MSAAGGVMRHWVPVTFGVAVLMAVAAAVEGLLLAGVLNRYIIPLPSEVVVGLRRIVAEEDILGKLLITGQECLYAMVLVASVGILMGALLHRVAVLRMACETWIAAMASAPIVLMYPLFLVIFGRSQTTIITMGFIAGLPPVILKTIEGLSGTRRVLIDVGKSFNVSPAQLFWKILFPAAMPTIFVGLRLGLIFCLINIVGVEFLINLGGLGAAINEFAERYDLAGTYAAICFVILTSVIFFVATERIERWLRPQD
ncbi:MAG TPA: ABC transporter permease subunit [Hyphomicrobiaceae bacterium]|nr:ABC transporter permease subunit [Hyphomicrobiaceae bacterium]